MQIENDPKEKSNKLLAVCLSKMDLLIGKISKRLTEYIHGDYIGTIDEKSDGKINKCFYDIKNHREIEKEINDFLESIDNTIDNTLFMLFKEYSLFGFSSIRLTPFDEEGYQLCTVDFHRIEEPFYWLFSKFGILDTNEIRCPKCGSKEIKLITPEQISIKKSIIQKDTYEVNAICNLCENKFYVDEEGSVI